MVVILIIILLIHFSTVFFFTIDFFFRIARQRLLFRDQVRGQRGQESPLHYFLKNLHVFVCNHCWSLVATVLCHKTLLDSEACKKKAISHSCVCRFAVVHLDLLGMGFRLKVGIRSDSHVCPSRVQSKGSEVTRASIFYDEWQKWKRPGCIIQAHLKCLV